MVSTVSEDEIISLRNTGMQYVPLRTRPQSSESGSGVMLEAVSEPRQDVPYVILAQSSYS